MKQGWEINRLDDVCEVEYGTRVVQKRDGGTIYPVYGGGGATFFMDNFNRENCLVVARFAMSEQCTRFVDGKFFLNDSGLTIKPKNEKILLPKFLNLQILCLNDYIYSLSRGTAQKNLNVPAFRNINISYPKSLPEQQRIVSVLDELFAAIAKAKTHAEQNLKNAKELFESYLQNIFEKKGNDWKEKRIQEITNVINGYAFTSNNFKPTNKIKSIKITNVGVKEFVEEADNYLPEKFKKTLKNFQAREGNIVIALTRTIISSGLKVAVVPESYDGALVNQRVAALVPNEKLINKNFLYFYLTTSGVAKYVLEHANTLMQPNLSINDLKNMPIPHPPLSFQQTIIRRLDALRTKTKRLEAIYQQKLLNLEELKKSILQKAFAGELILTGSSTITKIIPLQKIQGISPTDLQAGITVLALQKHIEEKQQHSFHHVKAEKIVHLSEYILNIDLERNPIKAAAGPNDFSRIHKVEKRAKEAKFYSVKHNGKSYDYQLGTNHKSIIQKTIASLGEKAELIIKIIDILIPLDTKQTEIIATVYAAWNNLIISGNQFTDNEIVTEARENWHDEKMQIKRERFFKAIKWMRENDLFIPKGNGKIVEQKEQSKNKNKTKKV